MTTEATAGNGGDPAGTQPAASGGAVGSQPAAPWYTGAGYTDDDRSFMENKGWTKQDVPIAPVALKAYRNLESVMGNKANAVILPRADDAKAMDEFYGKLGRPEKADGYTLPSSITPDVAQNFNPETVKMFQGWAHKARLTNEQYGALVVEHEAALAAHEEQATVRFNADVSRAKEKLVAEFGDQFGEQVARGNLAMRQLGITPDERDKLSEVVGVERATRLLMQVGGFLAQHKAVGLDNGGKPADSFVTDKARAASRIQAIRMLAPNATGPDADFKRAMLDTQHPEHKNVTAQWREWNRVANSK